MRVIRLNGELGKRFGRLHKLDVRSPAEAIRALCANIDGFHEFLNSSHERGVGYRCIADKDTLDQDGLHKPMSKSFSITPVVHGGGKIGSIILGVVLIAAAFIIAPPLVGALGPTLGMGTGIGFLGLTYANVAWLGVALVLGGVSQLLAPTPKAAKSGERNENNYFNGPVNNTAQGSAVPFGYGRVVAGSAVISASITVEQKPPAGIFAYDYPITGFAIP